MMSNLEPESSISQVDPDAWTIKKILLWSTDFLRAHGVDDSARLDVELLLSKVLGLTRISLYTNYDQILSSVERQDFKKLLLRRKEFEPVAYILEEKDFFKYRFKVSPDVLIPRSDTEILVETAITEIKSCDSSDLRLLDIGSGSGCISISLAKEFPDSHVDGVDISDEAILISTQNAVKNLAENVSFTKSDVFEESFWDIDQKYDLIASNPPYISHDEKESMSASVVEYEPHAALFAEDEGLEFYQVLSKRASEILNKEGKIIVEVGYLQSQEVAKMFKDCGWNNIEVIKDFSGHGRVVKATL